MRCGRRAPPCACSHSRLQLPSMRDWYEGPECLPSPTGYDELIDADRVGLRDEDIERSSAENRDSAKALVEDAACRTCESHDTRDSLDG